MTPPLRARAPLLLLLALVFLGGCAAPRQSASASQPPALVATGAAASPTAPAAAPTVASAPTAAPAAAPTTTAAPTLVEAPAAAPSLIQTPPILERPEEADAARALVVAAAAREAGVAPAEVQVVQVQMQEWPDAALGCPEPDQSYAQVITAGYLVTVRVQGTEV